MTRGRRILLGVLVAIALLVAALAAAAFLIPADRVAAVIAARAETIIGERVRLESVGLRFLPLPGVRLSGLSVGGVDDATALATARTVELRARLLPLLRGQIVLGSLDIRSPRVLLEIDSAGRPNLPLLGRDSVPAGEPRRDIRFEIGRVTVSDGRIGYRDARDGAVVRADGWDQELRLEGEVIQGRLGRIELAGWLELDDIDARLPDVVVPVRDLALRVTHDAALDRATDRLELRDLAVSLGDLALAGSGAVDSISSPTGRSAALRLSAANVDAAELVTLLPDSLRGRLALPDGRRLVPEGVVAVQLAIDGPVTADSLPAVDGSLRLDGGSLSVDGEPLLSEMGVEAAFSIDSVEARIEGRALAEPFSATITASSPAAPILRVGIRGRGDLARLRELGLVSDTLGLAGALAADIAVTLPTHDRAAAGATGTIELMGVALAGMDPALAIPRGTITLEGQRLTVDPLVVRAGREADIALTLAVDGWIPAVVDSLAPPPRVTGVARIDSLDLDRLLGEPEGEYPALLFARLGDRPLPDGRSVLETAQGMELRLPPLPRIDAELELTAGRLRRSGLEYSDVAATIRLTPTSVEIAPLRFGLMGGTVQATGRFEPTRFDSAGDPLEARVIADYAVEGVAAGSFFDRLTPFRDHLSGRLGMAGSVAASLDSFALPERTTLAADGGLALSQGRLVNWRVLEAAASRLGLTANDTIRFEDWGGTFRVTGSQVTLDETVLEGPLLGVRAAGAFDFAGRLDLGATLYLSRELAERAGSVGRQVVAVAGTGDRVPVGIRIAGTAESPRIELDLSAARENVVARARETAEREAQQLAARAAERAADRLELPDSLRGLAPDSLRSVLGDSLFGLLPDSLKLPGDSVASRVEDEVRSRLRRLLRGGN